MEDFLFNFKVFCVISVSPFSFNKNVLTIFTGLNISKSHCLNDETASKK